MAQPEIDGVITAKAAARSSHLRPARAILHEWRKLDHQISIERVLSIQPALRARPAVVPRFLVDRIDAEDLQLAAFDLRRQRVYHAALFVFPEPPAGGGKHDDRKAAIAI